MKKLASLVLTLILVATTGLSAFAVTVLSADIDTSASTEYYNPGDTVKAVLSVSDISFGEFDGVSAMEFDLYYDSYRVTPIVKAEEDSEGDKGDFTALISESPDNWEGFGVLDENNSVYKVAFTDMSGIGSVTENGELVIEIPFQTNTNINVGNIFFEFRNIKLYNANMEDYCEIKNFKINVRYNPQPNSKEELPADAISIDVAGYKNIIGNNIYYTSGQLLVRDYVCKFISAASGQETLANFAIIIVGADGVVSYCDTTIGNDKSEVLIPAGSYIVAVHKDSADFDFFVKNADVNRKITLYNITLRATYLPCAVELSGAGLVIGEYVYNDEFELALKDGVIGEFSDDGKYFFFFESELSPDDFKNLFVNPNFELLDKAGNPFEGEFVNTGSSIAVGEGITVVLVGDVTCDGKHSAADYFALKRVLFNTFTPDDSAYKACSIRGVEIGSADYLLLKKLIFRTISAETIYNQFWKD